MVDIRNDTVDEKAHQGTKSDNKEKGGRYWDEVLVKNVLFLHELITKLDKMLYSHE